MDLNNLLSEGDVSKFDKINDDQVYEASEFDLSGMNQTEINNCSKKEVTAKENKKICIKTSKRLQNQGKTANEIKSYIKERFASEFIPEGLCDSLNKEEGIFGVVLVDCSSLENKCDYDKLPLSMKNKHQYAIKCGCKNRYSFKKPNCSKASGDINSFISEQDDFSEMPISTEICTKTGLPVLKKVNDYTNDDAIKFLNNLEKNREITSEEKKNILKSSKTPLSCAKKAFQLINTRFNYETNKVVDNFNSYSLGKNNTSVKISKKVKGSLKVSNLTEAPVSAEVDTDKNYNISLDIPGGKDVPVLIENPVEKSLNINDFQEPKMNLNKIDLKKNITIDVDNEVDIPIVIEREFEIIPDIERGFVVDEDWYENDDLQKQDIEIDDVSENFSIDGRSKLLI